MRSFVISSNKHLAFLEEKRKDPITLDYFSVGDEIVFCQACGSGFLKSSWLYMGSKHCGQSETLADFPKKSVNLIISVKENILAEMPLELGYEKIERLILTSLFSSFFVFMLSMFELPFYIYLILILPIALTLLKKDKKWFITEKGISLKTKFVTSLIGKDQTVDFFAKNDIEKVVFFLKTKQSNKNNIKEVSFYLVDKSNEIRRLMNSTVENFYENNYKKSAQFLEKISSMYAISYFTEDWRDGDEVAKYLSAEAKTKIQINEISDLLLLVKRGLPLELKIPSYLGKLLFTDMAFFIAETGIMGDIGVQLAISFGDYMSIYEKTIYLRKDFMLSIADIEKLRFVATPDHCFVFFTNTNTQEEQKLYSSDSFDVGKGILKGLAHFAFINKIPLKTSIPSSFTLYHAHLDLIRREFPFMEK